MKSEKYTIVAPVLHRGFIVESGEIELETEQAERLIELGAIKKNEHVQSQEEKEETERKAAEEKAKKEAEKQLKSLRKKAADLGIDGADEKDAETLAAEIKAAEQK